MLEERKGIIAVDFDGTLCEDKWPEIGEPNQKLINDLITAQKVGERLILWTSRFGDLLTNAVEWCKEKGLIFDAVNDNLPEIVEKFGSNSRKIFADTYIDDKNSNQFVLPYEKEHGGMLDWAIAEVNIACARERGDSGTDDGEWDYGCACYESALKAFQSLCQDGHSGMSIGLTKQILVRLIEGKTLTPIDDIPEVWNDISHYEEEGKTGTKFQCKRMFSLFKDVLEDGTVQYHDTERYYCKDVHTGSAYRFGIVANIIDEIAPITMPYIPEDKSWVVYCEDFLFGNENGGDFDTFGVYYVIDPKGERKEINRFFKEGENGKLVDIPYEEFDERRKNKKVKEIIPSEASADKE